MNFSLMPNFGLYNLQNPEEKYNKKRPNCFSYYYVRVLRVDSILGTGRETHHTWAGETKHKSWQLV